MTLDDHGAEIRQLRMASGLSLREVSEAVGGAHPSLVHRIETGAVKFSRYSKAIREFLSGRVGNAPTPDPAAFAEVLTDACALKQPVLRAEDFPPMLATDHVIPAQHEVEVYENSAGAVVIKMDAGNLTPTSLTW